MITIAPGGLDDAAVVALLRHHLEEMHRHSPPGSVFALDLSGLREPSVRFWTVRREGEVAGCGAMKPLGRGEAEIKSMRTAPGHLRRGVAAALLRHIVATARADGIQRLVLETGSGAAFEPALGLYRAHGFAPCGAFGDYVASDFNQFLALDLA